MDNQQPVPRYDFSKMYPRIDLSKMYPRIDLSKIYPRIDLTKMYPRIDLSKIYPRIDLTKIYPQINFSKIAPQIDLTRIAFPKMDPIPEGFLKSICALDHSSKYPLGSFLVQGAAFEEYLSPDEAEFVLASGEADEVRWSAGELWESLTEQQQRLVKLGFLAILLVSVFVAVFMAQTEYAEFGQFLNDAQIPAGIAALVTSLVGKNLMKTKKHPINKKIRRN